MILEPEELGQIRILFEDLPDRVSKSHSATPGIDFFRIQSKDFIIRKTYCCKCLVPELVTTERRSTSLISHLAISLIVSPARLRAIGIARLGAIVKSMGFVAASPQDSILAIGFTDDDCDRSRVVRTSAEAPSLIAEAFAAVTVPSLLSIRYTEIDDKLEHRFQSWYFFKFETFIFFVHRNFDIPLFALDNDWSNLFVEMTCIPGL